MFSLQDLPTFQETVFLNILHYPQGGPYNITLNTNNNIDIIYLLSIHYVPIFKTLHTSQSFILTHSQKSTLKESQWCSFYILGNQCSREVKHIA